MAQAAVAPTVCFILLLVAFVAQQAESHAVMLKPESRQWYDYLLRYNYNPHAVFAGGVDKVSKGGTLKWPAGNRYSICGDAIDERKWDKPGPIAKSGYYKAGQKITVDVLFAQNHMGMMKIRLCPRDAKSEKQCKDLVRGDGKGTAWYLPWAGGRSWHGVVSGFEAPNYSDGFMKHYKLAPIGKAQGCAAWACDQFKGMYVYRTQWKLPAGYKCDHCKLQMYYLTGSSCWPPCVPGTPCLKNTMTYKTCGTPGAAYPEEFWGCSDVKIQ